MNGSRSDKGDEDSASDGGGDGDDSEDGGGHFYSAQYWQSSHSHQTRKRKGIRKGREGVKLSLSADNMMLCIENHKDSYIQVKKQQLEPNMEQQTGSKLGKEHFKAVCLTYLTCHPVYLNLYAEYIMQNARPDESHPGIKIVGRSINNLRYADDTTLVAESEEELERLLMKEKDESEKTGLKLNIQKPKFIASSPITSWQIDGGKEGTVTDFIFWGSKITADSDCSQEIKRCLLLGRKAMTNLDSTLKSRDITLLAKDHIVKAVVLPVVMYGCESCTTKKAECCRIDAFELWL